MQIDHNICIPIHHFGHSLRKRNLSLKKIAVKRLRGAKLAAILFSVKPSQNFDGLLDKLLMENMNKKYLRHVALMKKHTLCAGGPGLLHFSQVCVTENNLLAVFTAWCLGQNWPRLAG